MNNFPDFSRHGYQVIRELGRNREAGRITYLATSTPPTPPDQGGEKGGVQVTPQTTADQGGEKGGVQVTPQTTPDQGGEKGGVRVVIKEFRFADAGGDWSSFKAYQREIEVLEQLNHPRIPQYLDSFETPHGFCMVQEYKNAPSLAEQHSFEPEDIKQIAVSVLEILAYLQQRIPPIIHRDIKPENILVDQQRNAYVVDFGLARIRGGEVAMSSVAAGTPGFMPPEEQFGRPLTPASDLYSLGVTLICLLCGTRSVDVGKLIDENYRFDFKSQVPQLSPRFVEWLTKMVEPNLQHRFDNAAVALSALKPIPVKGGSIKLETPVRAIKLRKHATFLSLATIGFVAVFGAKSIIYQQPRSNINQQNTLVSQLLATRECSKCNLKKANLEGADLANSNLKGAKLEKAGLEGANLRGADLRDAKLDDARLKGADLGNAKLEDAKLKDADLGNARLEGADLEKANLKGANLEGANLEGANLEGADLKKANLKGANLNGAKLDGAKLDGATMPDGTRNRHDS